MKPERALSHSQFMELLRSRVDAIGTRKRAAQLFGVSGAYLSDVLNERREPGKKLLGALGYRREAVYARIPFEERP